MLGYMCVFSLEYPLSALVCVAVTQREWQAFFLSGSCALEKLPTVLSPAGFPTAYKKLISRIPLF